MSEVGKPLSKCRRSIKKPLARNGNLVQTKNYAWNEL